MNATIQRPVSASTLADALAVMRASTSLRHRMWMSIACVVLVAMGGLAMLVSPGMKAHSAFVTFLTVGNAILWSGWFGRLALLRTQATAGCLPGISTATSRTMLLGAGATVVLPGAALALLGIDPRLALGMPALGALGGLLFALVPWPIAVALVMVPTVGMPFLEPLLARIASSTGIPILSTSMLLPSLLVVAGLVAWRWVAVARITDVDALPRWRRPTVLVRPENAMDFGATPDDGDANIWQRQVGWLAPVTRADTGGPHDPVEAIGACLGGPMGRVAPREALKQWGLVGLLLAAVLVVPLREDVILIRDALLLGGLVGLLASGWSLALRLYRQRRRSSGEFAELALLPGLGSTPEVTREALLRCMTRRLTRVLLVALAAQALLAWYRDMAALHLVLMALLWIGTGIATFVVCLGALAGHSLTSIRMGVAMLPIVALAVPSLLAAFFRVEPGDLMHVLLLGWGIASIGYTAAALRLLRECRARSHAFLMS